MADIISPPLACSSSISASHAAFRTLSANKSQSNQNCVVFGWRSSIPISPNRIQWTLFGCRSMASTMGLTIVVASTVVVRSRKFCSKSVSITSVLLFRSGSRSCCQRRRLLSASHHPTSVRASRANPAIAAASVGTSPRIARIRPLASAPNHRVGSNVWCASSEMPSLSRKRWRMVNATSASISSTCRRPWNGRMLSASTNCCTMVASLARALMQRKVNSRSISQRFPPMPDAAYWRTSSIG